MIKAVIFDFDGTLADRNKAICIAYRQFLLEHVVNTDINKIDLETMVQQLIGLDQYGASDKQYVFEKFNRMFGYHVDYRFFREGGMHNLGKYEQLSDDTLDTLQYLKGKYDLAIITNGSTISQNMKIDNCQIREYFKAILISQQCGVAKPDSAIFNMALKQLNISAKQAIYVGDSYYNDIYGAYKANIKPIWINKQSGIFNSDGIDCITSLSQLNNIL